MWQTSVAPKGNYGEEHDRRQGDAKAVPGSFVPTSGPQDPDRLAGGIGECIADVKSALRQTAAALIGKRDPAVLCVPDQDRRKDRQRDERACPRRGMKQNAAASGDATIQPPADSVKNADRLSANTAQTPAQSPTSRRVSR
jgi:hypothetical protein